MYRNVFVLAIGVEAIFGGGQVKRNRCVIDWNRSIQDGTSDVFYLNLSTFPLVPKIPHRRRHQQLTLSLLSASIAKCAICCCCCCCFKHNCFTMPSAASSSPAAIFSLTLFIYIFNFYLHTFTAIRFTAEWAVDFYVPRGNCAHTRLQNRKFESISSGSDDAEKNQRKRWENFSLKCTDCIKYRFNFFRSCFHLTV